MRVKYQSRNHFFGTHKGATLNIERERDGRFYIIVNWTDGGALYDGWAPDHIRTMKEAKKEALYGAKLEPRPSNREDQDCVR